MTANCKRCGRPLKLAHSVEVGYGPTCKKKHDEAEAEFLKRQITIEEYVGFVERVVGR